jgi:hypothetical protein
MSLKLVSFVKGTNSYYFGVQSKDNTYSVIVDRTKPTLRCDCFFSSNMGINSKSSCKHKIFILGVMNRLKEDVE